MVVLEVIVAVEDVSDDQLLPLTHVRVDAPRKVLPK